jgi:hypothetical protein
VVASHRNVTTPQYACVRERQGGQAQGPRPVAARPPTPRLRKARTLPGATLWRAQAVAATVGRSARCSPATSGARGCSALARSSVHRGHMSSRAPARQHRACACCRRVLPTRVRNVAARTCAECVADACAQTVRSPSPRSPEVTLLPEPVMLAEYSRRKRKMDWSATPIDALHSSTDAQSTTTGSRSHVFQQHRLGKPGFEAQRRYTARASRAAEVALCCRARRRAMRSHTRPRGCRSCCSSR